jgi:hypothetical protein
MTRIKLTTDKVSGTCSIHDCDEDSKHLYNLVEMDVSDADVLVHTTLAEYCADHSQSHAKPRENLQRLGSFTAVGFK